ncbi:MAG: hypothetical protein O3B42_07940 [Actinomycetota bacterium]|nr:hypothetical protein [Actinomycetota bacterium]
MTTDQIMVTAMSSDTAESVAVISRAEQEAKQIVAKARYEAFRMVTDARAEAEAILAEQASASPKGNDTETDSRTVSEVLEAAEAEAAAIIKAAEMEAASAVDRWTENLEHTNAALISEHEVLAERLNNTKQLLERLEARLVQIAAAPPEFGPEATTPTPLPQIPNLPTVLPPRAPRPSTNPQPAAVTESVDAELAEDTSVEPTIGGKSVPTTAPVDVSPLDYSPSVPRPIPSVLTEEPANEERGSYYSRRSANLPSIGDSGSKDALTSIRSMRRNIPQDD